MSGMAKWSLGIGVVLLGAAAVCRALDQIPATVIVGIVGLLAVCMAGYDVLYHWAERAELRRRGARARREQERRQGH
ncbi:hypothetical protein [Amycolatopsis sp. 195334CR]|uniref:hypothetical protein n=1 Tax=Amycolatopsis sp. 195334CR TaxID=2814588 RepID=UPI001A8FAA6A|nr:hypothetical protein [Amycolatopsis sp. 195334CR]MBN6038310.1 hypothetical protein [Amycolatopsis sp. 195334CR]